MANKKMTAYVPVMPQSLRIYNVNTRANQFAILMLALYYVSLWKPPFIELPEIQWFIVLALSFVAFIFQRKRINLPGMQIFAWVMGLKLIGAFISLIRAPETNEALYGAIGLAVNIAAVGLFIPIAAEPKTRRVLLIAHILVSILWAIAIMGLVGRVGTLSYSSFSETGNNKNHIGIGMALSVVALLYWAVFWRPAVRTNRKLLLRWGAVGMAVFILFNLSLIYARSSILTVVLGILGILTVVVLKNKKAKIAGIMKAVITLGLLVLLIGIMLPVIMEKAPSWQILTEKMFEDTEEGTIGDRMTLINKGFYLIGQNPVFGVGIGGGRNPVAHYPTGLMHNTYLAEFVDLGILGIISLFIWIIAVIRVGVKSLLKLNLTDQIWMILVVCTLFSMIFKDLGTISLVTLLLFTGICITIAQSKRLKRWRPANS